MQLKPWSLQGKTSLNWNAGRTHKIDTWRYGFFFGNRWGHVVKFSGIVFFLFGVPTGTQRLDTFAYISFAKMLFSFEVWALNF